MSVYVIDRLPDPAGPQMTISVVDHDGSERQHTNDRQDLLVRGWTWSDEYGNPPDNGVGEYVRGNEYTDDEYKWAMVDSVMNVTTE